MVHRCLVGLGKFDRLLSLLALAVLLGTVGALVLLPVSALTIIICNTGVTVVGLICSICISDRRSVELDKKASRILELLGDKDDTD